MDHEGLIKLIAEIEDTCNQVNKKGGKECQAEIRKLKELIPPFVDEMCAHISEEEANIPALLRENFTEEEHDACVQKISMKDGLSGMRIFLPSIIIAMQGWASQDFIDQLLGSIPMQLRMLYSDDYLPAYETCVRPMRDAPLVDSMPSLSK